MQTAERTTSRQLDRSRQELLDLGLMSESDYEKMKQELGPVIMNK